MALKAAEKYIWKWSSHSGLEKEILRSQRPRGREIRNIYGNGAILAKRQLVIDLDWCHPQPSSEERRDEGSTDLNANTANAQLLSRAVARSSKSAGNIDRTLNSSDFREPNHNKPQACANQCGQDNLSAQKLSESQTASTRA